MTRVVRSAWLASLACLVSVSAAQAQSLADLAPMRVAGTAAATFGSKTSASAGGEFDYRLNDTFEVFFEVGRMFNIATKDARDRAERVGEFLGGTGDVKQAVNYFAAGVYHQFPMRASGLARNWTPYVGAGAGLARVVNNATFEVGGTDVTDDLLEVYGVELGNDLADATNKTLLVLTAGGRRILSGNITLDVSYRYGRIFKSADILDDVAVSTNRVQGGIGFSF
jgi:opacity protein-like surface antigen